MEPLTTYLLGALLYAGGGVLSCVLFFRFRLRLHRLTLYSLTIAFFVGWTWISIQAVPLVPSLDLLWGFLPFLTAVLCFIPPLVYMGIHVCSDIFEELMRPGSKWKLSRIPRKKEGWEEVRRLMAVLASRPGDVQARQTLAEQFLSMAYYDSALYEYRRLADSVERGYHHASVLYKIALIAMERKKDPGIALSTLRQIVRLYPKSYFAACSRRWLNQTESHLAQQRPEPYSPG